MIFFKLAIFHVFGNTKVWFSLLVIIPDVHNCQNMWWYVNVVASIPQMDNVFPHFLTFYTKILASHKFQLKYLCVVTFASLQPSFDIVHSPSNYLYYFKTEDI